MSFTERNGNSQRTTWKLLYLHLEGDEEVQELLSIFSPILISKTQAYAYTHEEKTNAIALNFESQFQGINTVD